MKIFNRCISVLALVLLLTQFPSAVFATHTTNLIKNGDFEDGNISWNEYSYDSQMGWQRDTSIITSINGYDLSGALGNYVALLWGYYDTLQKLGSDSFTLPQDSSFLEVAFDAAYYSDSCVIGKNGIRVDLVDSSNGTVIDTSTIYNANTNISMDDTKREDKTFFNVNNYLGRNVSVVFQSEITDYDCFLAAIIDNVKVRSITNDSATHAPIYRLYNTTNGAYLYTKGDLDRTHVLGTWSDFEYTDGVPAFYASIQSQQGLTPIYRLYNRNNGAYLYVRGDSDKQHVMSTWPEFEYTDGAPAFYASLNDPQDGSTPIYRLYNTKNGMYLYTRGIEDRNHVTSTWPEFEFTDGVPAFYATLN